MSQPMVLDIWAGDWGLPSVDLSCLRVMAYARFSGAPLQFRVVWSPFSSPSGKLPVFRHGNVVLTEFNDIMEYLKKKNFYANLRLSEQQLSDVDAYASYLEDKLLPALLYVWWMDEKNYVELTRPWYARHLRFPFNYYYPGQYEREARRKLAACFDQDASDEDMESYVYGEAQRCMNTLSMRLGESDFFLGSLPTSLDAIVFAYLSPLLRARFPSARLQNHLKASPNLVKFCTRIGQGYFASAAKEFEAKRAEETMKQKEAEEEEYPHQVRNWIMATMTAAAAMTGYMFSTGMLQVTQCQGNHEEDFDDDYDDEGYNNEDS